MATAKAPKQWTLQKDESLNSYNNWKENLIYTLSLDKNFARFIKPDAKWGKVTASDSTRGLVDDGDEVTDAQNRLTGVQKLANLNLMLGQIANFATVISRNQITKNSVSLGDIWSKIREHYGFHVTGSRFLDLASIQLQMGERHEDLYQRLLTFFDDNLLTTGTTLTHHSTTITENEEITPTIENLIVLTWLERIHVGLPSLIKQRYGAELRNKTLASIKPEISAALTSFLEELKADDSKICRFQQRSGYDRNSRQSSDNNRSSGSKFCCLCRSAKRPGSDTHFLSQCKYLPEADRKRMNSPKVRFVDVENEEDGVEEDDFVGTEENNLFIDQPAPAIHRRVATRKSPYMNCFYEHIPTLVCLDSGAESNLVSKRFIEYLGLKISPPSNQGAVQADQTTPLDIVGEIKNIQLKRGAHTFTLDALVTRSDIGDVIGGEPFLEKNDIALRPARKQIIVKGREIIPYVDANNRL